MELKEGYKQTEVGVIPEDWEVKEFGDVCKPNKSRINPLTTTEDYKCIELEHISQETGRLLGYAQLSDFKSQHCIFVQNDVLFGKLRPYLKKFLFAAFTGVCSTEIWVLKSDTKIYSKLLYYLVQSNLIIDAANQSIGTKMPRAEWRTVGKTKVPLPPTKTEQTSIATALSDTDSLIEGLEKLVAKKQNIRKGAMQRLFTPKEGWEVKKLGEECELVTKGTTPTSIGCSFCLRGINFIKVESLRANGAFIPDLFAYVDKNTHDILRRSQLEENDLLVSIAGALGRTGIVTKAIIPANTNQALAIVRLSQTANILLKYLFYYLRTERIAKHIEAISVQGAQPNLSLRNISDLPILFPPSIEAQSRIATILSDMDNEITDLETKLEKYKMIKQGMMQNLLTGKIRLV